MCDALVALPGTTAGRSVVFGKNSDRPVDDCQVLTAPDAGHEGETCRGSYVTFRRDKDPIRTLGCRPYWCWGYESGINEAGVVGGNTAIYTRALRTPDSSPGLTGMDLLRLGLEGGATASEAAAVITDRLERHGQWGSGVPGQEHAQGSYDNAFLIADRAEAWVIETAGRRWIAQRLEEGVRAVSNELSVRHRWSRASGDLESHAREAGWWDPSQGPFDFALAYADHDRYARQVSHIRRMRATALLEAGRGTHTAASMMGILRDHYEDTFLGGPQFHPFLPDFHTLCMHDSPAGFTWGNTATSLVVEMHPGATEAPIVWCCYGPPCASIYFPCLVGSAIPDVVSRVGAVGPEVRPATQAPPDRFHRDSLWWRFRRLIDAMAARPVERRARARETFDPIEAALRQRAREVDGETGEARRRAAAEMTRDAIALILDACARLEAAWGIGP